MKKIGIVLGHNSIEQGAINLNGDSEYKYWSKVCRKIGIDVIRHDPKLGYREGCIAIYDKLKAYDIVLELHFNNHSIEQANGVEALVWHTNEDAYIYGNLFIDEIAETFKIKKRKIKPVQRKVQRGYSAIQTSPCTHIILEPFFGSNKGDMEKCADVLEMRKFLKGYIKELQQF